MGGRLITPCSANNPTDLADGAVVVRARGRQARQNTQIGASVRPSPEPPAMRCAARSRCRRTARNRARLGLHLVVVALASNAAAPACDEAAAPCRRSPAVFLPALPGSVLRPEARQHCTVCGVSGATSQNSYDLHLRRKSRRNGRAPCIAVAACFAAAIRFFGLGGSERMMVIWNRKTKIRAPV